MGALRAAIRKATLGRPAKVVKRLVPVRDEEQPRVREQVLDENGAPEMRAVMVDGQPVLNDDGTAKMEPVTELRHPPLLGDDGQPIMVEVRRPSVSGRGSIMKAAKAASGDRDKLELAELQIEAVLRCSYEPGTDVLVFDEPDRKDLRVRPVGGWVDDLAEAALELLNIDVKDVEKNSSGTPTG